MASFVPTVAMTALQYSLESAQHKAAKKAQQSETAGQVRQLTYAQELENRARRDRLRRAIAAQRARFGGQGIASSGTASAVLEGLAAATDQEIATAGAVTALRVNKLNEDLARRRSLIEASSPQNRLGFSMIQRGLRTIPLLDDY